MEKKLHRITLLILLCGLLSCRNEASEPIEKEVAAAPTLEKVVEDSLAFQKKETAALNKQALQAIDKRNFSEAKNYLRKSLQIEPENATVLNNLGLIAMNQDSVELAKTYFSKAIFHDSTYYNAYINYSSLLVENDYFNQSVSINNYVIKYCKENEFLALAYFFNAYAYQQTGKKEPAREAIKNAVRLYPKKDHIYANMKHLEQEIDR